MHILRFLLFALLLATGCNKEIDEVLLPPFTVFPNPCQGYCQIALVQGVPVTGDATLFAPNGDEVARLIMEPGNTYTFQLLEEGIYLVTVNLDGKQYAGQILNTLP